MRGAIPIVVGAACLLAACGSSGRPITTMGDVTTTSTASTDPADPAVTLLRTETTAAPGATDTPMLQGDGLGVVAFGATADEMITAVSATLGDPVEDQRDEWESGDPTTDSPFTRMQDWNMPVSRVVCWGDGSKLCTFSGGGVDQEPRFVGWRQTQPLLSMAGGLGIGNRAGDFPALNTDLVPFSCTTAWADFRDVRIQITATAEPFITVDTTGAQIAQSPDPSTLVVTRLEAGYIGDNPVATDCTA